MGGLELRISGLEMQGVYRIFCRVVERSAYAF